MEYRFTSIMLRKREVGETDRFYTFYTREQGKITAIAKGVRKAEAKLASSLETATLSEIMMARSRGTGRITGAVLEESYPALHQSPVILHAVVRLLANIDRLVEPEEKDEALFSLLWKYLTAGERMAQESGTELQVRLLNEAAYYQLFAHLGYELELGLCAHSGEVLKQGEQFCMSFEAGGVVKETHAKDVNDRHPISENAIKALRLIMRARFEQLSKIIIDEKTLDELSRLRLVYERWIRR
ncbi:MAG: DNA repair protein RecO [Undibacterium sp.]